MSRTIYAKHNNWNGDIYEVYPAPKGLMFSFWVVTNYGERQGEYRGTRTLTPANTFYDAVEFVEGKYHSGHPPVEEGVVKHWEPLPTNPDSVDAIVG